MQLSFWGLALPRFLLASGQAGKKMKAGHTSPMGSLCTGASCWSGWDVTRVSLPLKSPPTQFSSLPSPCTAVSPAQGSEGSPCPFLLPLSCTLYKHFPSACFILVGIYFSEDPKWKRRPQKKANKIPLLKKKNNNHALLDGEVTGQGLQIHTFWTFSKLQRNK